MPVLEELAQEIGTYEANRERLLGEALGKYALIHKDQVLGTFDTESDAISVGYRTFGNAPFLVRVVRPVDQPAIFLSPVVTL